MKVINENKYVNNELMRKIINLVNEKIDVNSINIELIRMTTDSFVEVFCSKNGYEYIATYDYNFRNGLTFISANTR